MAASSHALLSPSASHRWLHCTPSARLEENVQDKGSEFAEEGTCAHALCENKLRTMLGQELVPNEFDALKEKWFDKAMDAYTDEYVAYVWNEYQEALKKDKAAQLLIEKTLDFTPWIKESFGTGDCIIIAEGTCTVIDFKYGKGVEVSAHKNTQMAIYALGAIADYILDYDIDTVKMVIVQPRLNNISEWEWSREKLEQWGNQVLIPLADKAFKGEGEQHPGEWCKFCKVKATCKALANDAISCYTQHDDKAQISDAEMPGILSVIPAIKSWCTAVEDYATAQAIAGKHYEGYKIVEGRSVRKVSDKETLISNLLGANYVPEDIFNPAELKSIGDLEKLVGKKEFARLAEGCLSRPQGKPTLVPESDKRPVLNVTSAEEDFGKFNN